MQKSRIKVNGRNANAQDEDVTQKEEVTVAEHATKEEDRLGHLQLSRAKLLAWHCLLLQTDGRDQHVGLAIALLVTKGARPSFTTSVPRPASKSCSGFAR